ncbi:MAG: hypothetical protein ACE366_26090 [Bradymonadia bacterium]
MNKTSPSPKAAPPPPKAMQLRWLHLADLDLGTEHGDVRFGLICDRAQEYVKRGQGPDFVIVSGQLLDRVSGRWAGSAEREPDVGAYLERLAVAAKVSHERVFVVPGPSDIGPIMRRESKEAHKRLWRRLWSLPRSSAEAWATYWSKFDDFIKSDSNSAYTYQRGSALWWAQPIRPDDLPVHVLGLNTCWRDYPGQPEARAPCVVDQSVVKQAVDQTGERLSIIIAYDDPGALKPQTHGVDLKVLQQTLEREAHIICSAASSGPARVGGVHNLYKERLTLFAGQGVSWCFTWAELSTTGLVQEQVSVLPDGTPSQKVHTLSLSQLPPATTAWISERLGQSGQAPKRRGRRPAGIGEPSATDLSPWVIQLDRMTEWGKLIRGCRNKTGHFTFLLHGDRRQDLDVFIDRIKRDIRSGISGSHYTIELSPQRVKAARANNIVGWELMLWEEIIEYYDGPESNIDLVEALSVLLMSEPALFVVGPLDVTTHREEIAALAAWVKAIPDLLWSAAQKTSVTLKGLRVCVLLEHDRERLTEPAAGPLNTPEVELLMRSFDSVEQAGPERIALSHFTLKEVTFPTSDDVDELVRLRVGPDAEALAEAEAAWRSHYTHGTFRGLCEALQRIVAQYT